MFNSTIDKRVSYFFSPIKLYSSKTVLLTLQTGSYDKGVESGTKTGKIVLQTN